MADASLPPQYTPFTPDANAQQQQLSQQQAQQNAAIAPQVQTYQSQLPLIQTMYQQARDQLQGQLDATKQQNQAATTNQIGTQLQGMGNRGLANSTFANSMQYNANQALANRNDNASRITDAQLLQADNQRAQQAALINQAIAKLQGDAADKAQAGVQQWLAQQEAQHQAQYDDQWKRYSAQQAMDQASQQRALQLALANISHGDALQAHNDALSQAAQNQWIGAYQSALKDAQGKSPLDAQNEVYQFLKNNQGAMKAQGVDPNSLGWWSNWQDMNNSARAAASAPQPAPAFQSTGSASGDLKALTNVPLSLLQNTANYLSGNKSDLLTNTKTMQKAIDALKAKGILPK